MKKHMNILKNTVLSALALAVIGFYVPQRAEAETPGHGSLVAQYMKSEKISVGVKQAEQILAVGGKDVLLLDVRTPFEFRMGHIDNAQLIPVQELAARFQELNEHRDKLILVYCRTQNRSSVATEFLRKQGFHAVFVEGGYSAWK